MCTKKDSSQKHSETVGNQETFPMIEDTQGFEEKNLNEDNDELKFEKPSDIIREEIDALDKEIGEFHKNFDAVIT